MKTFLNTIFLLLANVCFLSAHSQYLKNVKLSDKEKAEGAIKKYTHSEKYDGNISLILYRNKKYFYTIESTIYNAFSQGHWSKTKSNIYLTSAIIDTAVPIEIKYISNEDSLTTKSPFLLPVNLKGDRFPDARIFINNDTTFCFPFFDTCIGHYSIADSVKIDFGDGFKTKWHTIPFEKKKNILFIVQSDYIFSSYLSFYKRRLKIVRSKLKL